MTSKLASLLQEAKINSQFSTLSDLLVEDIQTIDKSIPQEEIDFLVEWFAEDPELINEFLGTIAGLGGKAAKWLSSKASGAGKKLSDYSDKKTTQKNIKSSRKEHTSAVKAYGKALKGKDEGSRREAYKAMVAARNKSRGSRGLGEIGNKPSRPPKKAKAKFAAQNRSMAKRRIYKRLGEALVNLYKQEANG